MDRTWIRATRFSDKFTDGVDQFMSYVRDRFNADDVILCPCRHCLNQSSLSQKDVHNHVYLYGWSATYTRWVQHGEAFDAKIIEIAEDADDPDHLGDVVNEDEADNEDDLGTIEMLADLYTAVEEDGEQPMFVKVLEDAKCALWPGSVHSRFSFLVRLLHIKSFYRISNTAISVILKLLARSFPNSCLPDSYDKAKTYLKELGLGYELIHVCDNNCVLFRKNLAKADICPKCKESRWVDADGAKRVPKKVLRYFPLIPRLKRMFANKATSEETWWHKEKRVAVENEMTHPADGEAWKDFDDMYPSFAKDARNLRLSLAIDGFNPFGNMNTSYSMWPVLVKVYNLPPWSCTDASNCIMALLIPGPKSPGKDFDVFLEPLIEDLLKLWEGVRTYDALTGLKFDLCAAVLWCIHDYPALGVLLGRITKGYYACIYCNRDPLSRSLRKKICYIGHRRYLPKTHKWRRSLAFDGHRENQIEPAKLTVDETLEALERVKDVSPGKPEGSKKRKRGQKDQEPKLFSRKSALWKLPYWKHLKLPHNLDVMHIEKNICDALLGIILRLDGKNKDTVNARLDLQDMGIRPELHLEQEDGDSVSMPAAWYAMEKEERTAFCGFMKSIRFPYGYASNLTRCISADGLKVQGLKTHDCHILLQRILPTGLRGLVHKDIYEAVAELGKFFWELCSRKLKVDVVKRLKAEIPVILCKLEKIFPPAFFDVMVHLAVHLPDEALLRGPVQYGWMYPIERQLGTLKGYVRNRARPEGSIAEAYIANEALTFCSRYMEDVVTRFNRDDDKWDPPNGDLSVFQHGVKLLGANRETYLENKEFDKLCWYVLNNCDDVEPYLSKFREELEKEGGHDIESRLEKEFPAWFRSHIKMLWKDNREEDTQFGDNWRVVQKFEHRSMYDVNETEASTVHQDETGSDNELEVQDDQDDGTDEPTPVQRHVDGQKSSVVGNLQALINRREEDMAENSDEDDDYVDDTILEYCSDNDRDPMECNDDD
ncbi:uncharacterized protein [Miscanthus floridulus]|uniref:uncharacterized protein n=1 Tax=Miscanthus floridulus TaxID=154761 RepID=UPI003458AB8E